MLDENSNIYSNDGEFPAFGGMAVSTNSFSETGPWVNIGKTGFPQGAQFYMMVPTRSPDRELKATLQMTLDNGTTVRDVSSMTFETNAVGLGARRAVGIESDFNPQAYAAGEDLDVRVIVEVTDHAEEANFGFVRAATSASASERRTEMGHYISSTVSKFRALPCPHEGQHELAEHEDRLEIACTHCGKAVSIPLRCACGKKTACDAQSY